MFGGEDEKGTPGPKVNPSDVAKYPDKPLYDPAIVRTLFLNFEDKDWEPELADFHGSDVELPATLKVDGKTYPNVGVHFRGMSSYMMVRAGAKRSLNVSVLDGGVTGSEASSAGTPTRRSSKKSSASSPGGPTAPGSSSWPSRR